MDFFNSHFIINLITITLSYAMIDTNTNKLNFLTDALGELVLTSRIVNDTLRLADGKYNSSEMIQSNQNVKSIHSSFNELPVEKDFDKTKKSKIHFNKKKNIDEIIKEASDNIINAMPTESIRKKRDSVATDIVEHKKETQEGEKIRNQITKHLDEILKETVDKQNEEDSNELKSRLEKYNISSKYDQSDSNNLRPLSNAGDDFNKSDEVSVNTPDPSVALTTDILSKYLDKGEDESLEVMTEDVEKIKTSSNEPAFNGVPVKVLLPMLQMKNSLSQTINSGYRGVKNAAEGFSNFLETNARRLGSAIMLNLG